VSIREEWPNLSPRERDARAAKDLGFDLVERVYGQLGTRDETRIHMILEVDSRHPRKDSERCFRVPWDDLGRLSLDTTTLPGYSTEWTHAGSLLDKLREEGWRATLWVNADGAGVTLSRTGTAAAIDTGSQPSAPGAIALAFCLLKELEGIGRG